METQNSSPLIAKLSIELKQMVLSSIPDVFSLRSAALSCRSLCDAFFSAETIIIRRVLLNQVDYDVLPEALIAESAVSSEPFTEELIADFIAKHLGKRQSPPELPKTLRDAIPFEKFHTLHTCVRELASQFIATAAMKSRICRSRPATSAERCRIERAMYRFQIFCSLFRGCDDYPTESLQQILRSFFSHFSPWENEQLACVHDYLIQAVFPAFKDVAEHDITWGKYQIEFNKENNHFVQYLLTLGLETLRRISMAEKYEARYRLLDSGYYPRSRLFFLDSALRYANEEDDSGFTLNDEQTHISRSFFDDPDTGPLHIWRWAHRGETSENFVNQGNRKSLREWGYVMWDQARLDESDILHSPWIPPSRNLAEDRKEAKRREDMRRSWRIRSDIYNRGGRGWWSFEDGSKIIWKYRQKAPLERRSVNGHRIPLSLEEAKDTFRLLKLPASVERLNKK